VSRQLSHWQCSSPRWRRLTVLPANSWPSVKPSVRSYVFVCSCCSPNGVHQERRPHLHHHRQRVVYGRDKVLDSRWKCMHCIWSHFGRPEHAGCNGKWLGDHRRSRESGRPSIRCAVRLLLRSLAVARIE
jgi:hypothetical protein